MKHVAERLLRGEVVRFRPRGNSMSPRVESGEEVEVFPCGGSAEVGDVVFCRVRGRYLLHLVTAVFPDGRYQISNNRGHVNGATKQILGKLME